jgi:hypothetical protein
MDFKGLEQLISEIATQQSLDKSAVIDDLADILKMKYGISIMAKERELIDEVKMRIITKLYNSDFQKIEVKSDLPKVFKLELLELDYLDTSIDELQHEGLIKSGKSDIVLTKEGVMKFKTFYGEI